MSDLVLDAKLSKAVYSSLITGSATRTFSGTPGSADMGSLSLRVTATDAAGASASAAFNLAVDEPIGITLTGSGTLQGTANADTLYASGYQTHLIGGAGNDTLTALVGGPIWDLTFEGGAGNDTLTGSYARDLYLFNAGDGHDTLIDNAASYHYNATAWFDAHPDDPDYQDEIDFGEGIAADQLWFQQSGNDLEISVIGTNDRITVKDWYVDNYHRIEVLALHDGTQLLDENVQNLVQAMAGFSPPAAGQTTLPSGYQATLSPVIAANWQ